MTSTILVVENDAMSRELARRVLTAGGYAVECVDSAEAALDLAPRLLPHLVLMDLGLPGIDGIEAASRLRGARATKAIPVALLSAHVSPAEADRARDAGCAGFLTKPIGARELLDRVAGLLGAAPPAGARAGTFPRKERR